MLLSIIIPVYNVESYVIVCINSVLDQDFKNYELLLIDDGSTDGSGEICDNYARKDQRVRVFHQQNAGVSAARNLGLENAEGKWICFVDGDDRIEKNSLSRIIQEAENHEPEMLIARSFHYENEAKGKEKYPFDVTFLNRSFDGYGLIVTQSYKRGSVCGAFYRREFLKENDLKFPLGLRNGEDSIFISLCHLYVRRIRFVNVDYYLVIERTGSASRSWNFERVFKMVDNIHYINDYMKRHSDLQKGQKDILYYTIYGVVSAIFNHLYFCFSIPNYFKIKRAVRKELNVKIDTGAIPINKKKIRFLNLSLNLYSINVLLNQWFRQLSK